ncbi:hypothetical protein GOBAR_AA35008 [Gossypium barbadense]|uniref:Uncharacterized protein n=1 Tax=Gossypium barbadense TaxID=3634 RepID=A0A2P5W3H8_GOSBA|nr:hypothetical protein GOBAR_AA35008 [Gossypium barbadense]
MSGHYLAARQLEFFKGRNDSGPNKDSLVDALAIAQIMLLYVPRSNTWPMIIQKRLPIGYTMAEKAVAPSLVCLTDLKPSISYTNSTTNFQQSPLLNITYCLATGTDHSHGKILCVVIYNSLEWKRK